MSKKQEIEKLIKFSVLYLRHKIGSIVNKEEIYSSKYAKEAESFLEQTKKVARTLSLNVHEKEKFKEQLKKDLKLDLENKSFLNSEKFNYIEKEVNSLIKELKL